MPTKPPFKEAFMFWLKLGFISFGGPAGQIAIVHDYLVEKRKWISPSRYLHALNYCMLLPGPEALQLVIYTAWLMYGTGAAIVAGLLFIVPAIILLLVLSALYCLYGSVPFTAALLTFVKPAVVALVIGAVIKLSKKAFTTQWYILFAVAAFVLVYFFKIDFAIIVLGALVIGWMISAKQYKESKDGLSKLTEHESEYFINANTLSNSNWVAVRNHALLSTLVFVVLCSVPLVIIYLFAHNSSAWYKMSLFFTKAAFVTFGGAYAVLPYVAQMAVEKFQWLTAPQMMDGLALGESTPGPLIIVLQFVGFLAGYHLSQGSMIAATFGALLTSFYTFAPSFFMVMAGAPVIEKTKDNPRVKSILAVVSATVVGVMAYLCITLLMHLFRIDADVFSIENIITAMWMVASLVALQKYKVNVIYWIAISLAAGIVYYFVS